MQEKLKYAIAYVPAWGFYWAGDLVSKLMHLKHIFDILFPIYSAFMGWSLFFSDWGNIGVWLDSTENTDE